MDLSVSMYSYFRAYREGRIDVPGFIRAAARAGVDGVELLSAWIPDPDGMRPAIQAALDETGLPVSSFSVSNNFAQIGRAERELALAKILVGIDEAVHYRAPVVRVFAGDVDAGIELATAREWIVEGLAAASRYADSRGVRLALENHGKLAGRSDQVRALVMDVRAASGVDALGACPDTGNFLLVDQPGVAPMKEVADVAVHVHFKDFAPEPAGHTGFAYESLAGLRYVGTAIGEGTVDLKGCVDALRDAAYEGWLSIEFEGEEDPFTAVPRSVVNARRFA